MMGAIFVATDLEAARSGEASVGERRPPEMAPERKVAEQDCTQPIDYSLGNIRCK
jgi:hypothetical protein